MQQNSTRAFLLVGFILLNLNGCAAPLALTLFGVGAGVTTGTAVSYTMDGIAYSVTSTGRAGHAKGVE
jgi:hypothetical protein